MEIEFIKWMCEKAEGFELESNVVLWEESRGYDLLIVKASIAYPLLLQRAIEGVTRSHSETSTRYWIEMSYNAIEVYDSADGTVTANYYFDEFQGDIDQAKESALKYVHEQEIKENK